MMITPSITVPAIVRVRDVMNDNVLTVQDTEPARLAVQMMLWGGFRHLPVMHGKKLVGMITDRDVYEAEMRAVASNETAVAELMRTDVRTAAPDDAIGEVALVMAAAHIHAMPVVDHQRLVGIVTSHDLLACMANGSLPPPITVSAKVADVMCREPRYVNPDDDIRVALTIMVEQQIRHLPVVDAHDMLVGIVSDRDLRAAVGDPIEALRDDDDDNLVPFYIADVMTANPISIKPDAPLADLSWSLLDEKVGAVPVVDDDDHLVGIVSYVDVLHFALRGLP